MDTSNNLIDSGFRIGWAIGDITPEGPISMFGQYYNRMSTYVQSHLKVTACAMESLNMKKEK